MTDELRERLAAATKAVAQVIHADQEAAHEEATVDVESDNAG